MYLYELFSVVVSEEDRVHTHKKEARRLTGRRALFGVFGVMWLNYLNCVVLMDDGLRHKIKEIHDAALGNRPSCWVLLKCNSDWWRTVEDTQLSDLPATCLECLGL